MMYSNSLVDFSRFSLHVFTARCLDLETVRFVFDRFAADWLDYFTLHWTKSSEHALDV